MFTWYITTNVQTLCWSKTSPSFSGAHSSCIARSINTIYLRIWCDSFTFCLRGHFFTHPVLTYEPWGYNDHTSSEWVYVHALGFTSIAHSPRDCVSSLLSPPQDVTAGAGVLLGEEIPSDSDRLVSTEIHSVRPGAVLFVPVLMAGCYWLLMNA